jgi:peptide/nickel transport system ATP-binding protein/oligopeptide transport system ATP-binding protein
MAETNGTVNATNGAGATNGAVDTGPMLSVTDLVKEFPFSSGRVFRRKNNRVQAVSGVSFDIEAGQTLGLVGESGSGKTTTGRALLRLHEPTSGSIRYNGKELTTMGRSEMREARKDLQIVFQDPFASLNPKMPINDIIGEAYAIHGDLSKRERLDRVGQLLRDVGLRPEHGNRFPHEFSGGQRQRIGIARALTVDPNFIVLDEPVSALDVSVQAGVINLLEELQAERGIAYLFIAHDLSVVRHVSDRVAVMYLGKIVEIGERDAIYASPSHPYTQALLSAVPVPDPRKERTRQRIVLEGDIPSPISPPSGCRFRTRCWRATDECADAEPEMIERRPGLWSACHHPIAEGETVVAVSGSAG